METNQGRVLEFIALAYSPSWKFSMARNFDILLVSFTVGVGGRFFFPGLLDVRSVVSVVLNLSPTAVFADVPP